MEHLLLIALSNAATATALAIAIALIGLKIRQPAVLHVLWLLVLLRLLAPPLFDFGVLPAAEATATFGSLALRPVPVEAAPIAAASPTLSLAVRLALGLWFSGSLLIAVLIAARTRRFHQMLDRAEPGDADLRARVASMADRIGCARLPRVLTVDLQISPLVWSAFGQPILVLPRGLLVRLSPQQLDTIIAHELAHLKRGDHRVRWMELAAIVLFWWNPTTWWACRRLRFAEEECCDLIVMQALPDRAREYASSLVESIRQLTIPDPWPLDVASPLGRTATIERRIKSMFTRKTSRPLSTPLRAILMLIAVMALGLTPLLTAREVAAVEGGDFTGAPITLTLKDADLGDVLSTFADLAGIDILTEPSVKGTVSIEVTDKPWDEALDLILRENGLVYSIDNGRIIVRDGAAGISTENPLGVGIEGELDGNPVYRFSEDGKITEPKKIDGPAPTYPETARKEGIMGVVLLDCTIDASGSVRNIEVLRSLEGGLTEAAEKTVRQWTFDPATMDGEKVSVKYIVTVKFRLQ